MSLKVASTLELDGVEKYFCIDGSWSTIGYAAHLTGDHSAIAANATHAIQHLLKRHPRMRTRFRLENNRYFLDVLEYDDESLSVDSLFSVVKATTDESWQQIVENRCNQNPYSDDGSINFPLFHFMLVIDRQSSEIFHLLIFANHCVSDGRSGYILINEFLTLALSSNLNDTFEPINREILPFIHQLIPRPYGRLFPLISVVAKRVFRGELSKLRHPRIPVKPTPLIDCGPSKFVVQRYKLKFLFGSSSSGLYSNLRQQCHSHHVTMHGPLFGCLLLATHHCFPLNNTDRLAPFTVGMPFDMRTRLPESSLTSSSIGFFIGMGNVKLNRSLPLRSTPFWTLVDECMRITHKQLEKSGVPLSMHTFSDILRDEREMNRIATRFPEGREGELAFSNIGKYPFSCDYNQSQVKLHGIHVANNASVYRVSSSVFVTCTGDSQLNFSLAHEIESEEKAKEFFDYYIRLVEVCADGQRCKPETTLEELLQSIELK